MTDNRPESGRTDRRNADSLLMVESLRSADAAGRATDEPPPAKAKKSDEESISLFWRVFGGTIVSIAALVFITLYNNLSGGIAELRSEVARVNEAKGEFAKKDDVNAVRVQATTHAGYRAEIDSLKERASKYRLELEDAKKALTVSIDGMRKDVAAVELLKERLAAVTADLKAARDDAVKVRADVDKNQAADNERRDRRDVQMKQLDETLKEMAKTVQETREKLARLEGQQSPAKPAEVGPPKPVRPKTATPIPGDRN